MHTARMTVLLPPDRKAEVERKAAALGISTGELVRRAVADFDQMTPEQEAELEVLVEQANKAIPAMAASLDNMIATVRGMRENIRQTLACLSAPA
jgi:hypothetical protein